MRGLGEHSRNPALVRQTLFLRKLQPGAGWDKHMSWLGTDKNCKDRGEVVYGSPSANDAETEGWQVQDQPELQIEFRASLGSFVSPYHKLKKTKKTRKLSWV